MRENSDQILPSDMDESFQASFSDELGNALEYAWGPIFVSVVFSLALALPDPSHEALMAVAENMGRNPQGLVAGLLTLLAFFFLPPSLHLATLYALETPRYRGRYNRQIEQILLVWVGRLPIIAAALAITRILYGADQLSIFATVALSVFLVYAVFTAATGIWVFLSKAKRNAIANRFHINPAMIATQEYPAPPGILQRAGRFLARLYFIPRNFGQKYPQSARSVCLVLLVILAFFPRISVFLGPITVTLIFVSVAAQALAWLTRLSTHFAYGRMPLILVVLGLVMAGAGPVGNLVFLGLALIYGYTVFIRPGNSSVPEKLTTGIIVALAAGIFIWGQLRHDQCPALSGCHLILGKTPVTIDPPDMASAFSAWKQARPAAEQSAPIRLIAAEGGGLFAAYYTGMYLAKRADAEGPAFSRSIFAISGVSGGSVGAAAFWSVRASGLCDQDGAPPDCHQQAVRSIIGQDYLSPVLARMFTLDLFDRVLPLSSLPTGLRLERASQLELAMIAHSNAATGHDPDSRVPGPEDPIADSWSPERQLPALFLNTTRVATGDRVILSPFSRLTASDNSPTLRIQPDGGGDMPVATAAFMSARFPVVTAAARMIVDGQQQQIVDGGYFDNSGIETIHDILNTLKPTADDDMRIISLTTERPETETSGGPFSNPTKGLSGTPLSAFLGAWRTRLDLSMRRTQDAWNQGKDPSTQDETARITQFRLPLNGINYTVSWYLDRSSFCGIEDGLQSGLPKHYNWLDSRKLTLPQNCAK